MIVVMKTHSSQKQLDHIVNKLESVDFKVHLSKGVHRTIIGVIGEKKDKETMKMKIEAMDGVEKVISILDSYKLTGRDFKPEKSVIDIDGIKIGGEEIIVMAGPCSVENEEQIIKTAIAVRDAGAKIIRGGAYKPRTSPYAFQGLGEKGLELLAEIKDEFNVAVATEIVGVPYVEKVAAVADVLQVGARNCQNYHLLEVAAKAGRPV